MCLLVYFNGRDAPSPGDELVPSVAAMVGDVGISCWFLLRADPAEPEVSIGK